MDHIMRQACALGLFQAFLEALPRCIRLKPYGQLCPVREFLTITRTTITYVSRRAMKNATCSDVPFRKEIRSFSVG